MVNNKNRRTALFLAISFVLMTLWTPGVLAADLTEGSVSDVEYITEQGELTAEDTVMCADPGDVVYITAPSNRVTESGVVRVDTPSFETAPTAQTRARGQLTGNSGYVYDRQEMYYGELITISVRWEPTNATLQVGVREYYTGLDRLVSCTDGRAEVRIVIPRDGTYSIYIYNESNQEVDFTASYIITNAD